MVLGVGRMMIKGLDEHVKLPYRMKVTEDQAEGGYVVSFLDLPE